MPSLRIYCLLILALTLSSCASGVETFSAGHPSDVEYRSDAIARPTPSQKLLPGQTTSLYPVPPKMNLDLDCIGD